MVQTAERDRATIERGQRAHFWNVGEWVVAPEAIGQAYGSLGVGLTVCLDGIEKRIGQAIVHCLEAGRSGICEPTQLDWRWSAGKRQQAAATHVHGEIDQDVDSVSTHEVGKRLVIQSGDFSPNVDVAADAIGEVGRLATARIAEDLEL